MSHEEEAASIARSNSHRVFVMRLEADCVARSDDEGIDQREPNSPPAFVYGDAHGMCGTVTPAAQYIAIVA